MQALYRGMHFSLKKIGQEPLGVQCHLPLQKSFPPLSFAIFRSVFCVWLGHLETHNVYSRLICCKAKETESLNQPVWDWRKQQVSCWEQCGLWSETWVPSPHASFSAKKVQLLFIYTLMSHQLYLLCSYASSPSRTETQKLWTHILVPAHQTLWRKSMCSSEDEDLLSLAPLKAALQKQVQLKSMISEDQHWKLFCFTPRIHFLHGNAMCLCQVYKIKYLFSRNE